MMTKLDSLSDCIWDKDQSLYHNDEYLQLKITIPSLSDTMEGEYFQFSNDNNMDQIIVLKEAHNVPAKLHKRSIHVTSKLCNEVGHN